VGFQNNNILLTSVESLFYYLTLTILKLQHEGFDYIQYNEQNQYRKTDSI